MIAVIAVAVIAIGFSVMALISMALDKFLK